MNYDKPISSKTSSESEFEYCMRICDLKDEYDLSWKDIAEIINSELNTNYSPDKYRKAYYKYNTDRDAQQLAEISNSILSLKKERVKLQEERTQINGLVRSLAREETLKEIALDVVESISQKKFLDKPRVHVVHKYNKKGILVISDWHYGIDVTNYYNTYNTDIAKSRIYDLLEKSISIIHKEELDEIYLLNLGDMISGIIHLPLRINSRLDVISQTMEISEILAEFISELSNECVINYGSVSDNHSRLDPNKKEALQPESFTRIIDWYLELRLQDNPNVYFLENKFGDDICSFDIFNYKVLAVHGDKDPQKKILSQLVNFTQEHYDIVFSAHKHHFYADESNEVELYSNGSLMGTDDYANSLRVNNKPSQLFVVVSKENISYCVYKIKL